MMPNIETSHPGLGRLVLVAGAGLVVATALLGPAEARRSQAPVAPQNTSPFVPADTLEGNFLSAYIAGASRDTSAAAVYYREALRDDPGNPELMERAFISLLADGDFDAAVRSADRLVARDPGNGLAQLSLGVRAFKNRQYGIARTIFSRSGRGRTADLTATLLSAWAYAGARDGKRALDIVGGIRGERGFAVFRDYHAGLIAELVGNAPEADRHYKAAYDGDKATLRIVDAYGRFLYRQGRKDEAVAVYRGFEALAPRHPFVRSALTQIEAGKPLPPIVQTAQDGAAEVLYGLGTAGTQQGDELASLIYLRLAVLLNPEHSLALVQMADVFERLKQPENAIETLRRVPAASPLKTSADVQIGLGLEALGQGDEAVRLLGALRSEKPEDTDVLVALANVLRSRKKYSEAADIYTVAIDKTDDSQVGKWPLYYYRGTTYERAKDWDKAEADLKRALELVPETQPLGRSQVLNYLGYSWVDNNRNIDEAFRMLKRAVELNPRDGQIIDSLGWAYYRLGQYEDAVRELEKAAELKAGDPVINDHLGDAYWQIGRKLEAKFQWQHAKDSGPEPEDAKKIDEKLADGIPDPVKPAEAQGTPTEPAKSGG